MRAGLLLLGVVVAASGCREAEAPGRVPAAVAPPEGPGMAPGVPGMLTVTSAWARPAAAGGTTAAYFLITNSTEVPDTLRAVAWPQAATVELHETVDRGGGVRGMQRVQAVPVPAGDQVAFAPGGLHVMLIDVADDVVVGDTLALTLTFASGTSQTVHAPVRLE